jgi:hypothetical protein
MVEKDNKEFSAINKLKKWHVGKKIPLQDFLETNLG